MNTTLAETIRSLRKERKLTQEQLAEAVGVTISAVSKWEAGLSNPDISMLPELLLQFVFTHCCHSLSSLYQFMLSS